jgi:hypothetical protein
MAAFLFLQELGPLACFHFIIELKAMDLTDTCKDCLDVVGHSKTAPYTGKHTGTYFPQVGFESALLVFQGAKTFRVQDDTATPIACLMRNWET